MKLNVGVKFLRLTQIERVGMISDKILYIQYTNPAAYPPLQHSSQILADKGWKVLFLGIGMFGSVNFCFPHHVNISMRQLTYCNPGWRQKLHYLWYSFWVVTWTFFWRPQWIYVSDPLATPIGLILSYLPNLKIIYHEHDSPNGELTSSVLISVALRTRNLLAERALAIVFPNEKRKERFQKKMTREKNSVHCIWNCPSKEEASSERPSRGKGDSFNIIYHGSIVPLRVPLTILGALSNLPDFVKLIIVGYETIGHRGYTIDMKKETSRLGIENRLEIIPAVPRNQLFKYCLMADVGLALMPNQSDDINMQSMVGASNKVFDYLACGLAVLVSDLPDWQEMIVKPGYGLACDPDKSESIAAAIHWFLDHRVEMRAMGERGRKKILSEWNYEMQFAPVLEVLNGKTTC